MDYELRPDVPTTDDYIRIRCSAGLSLKSHEAASVGLSNSIYCVCVYFEEEPVGIGRIIGDGGCFFEIVDIAVLPQHQKKGLGDMIMRALMDYLHANAPDTAYVSLMADHGTPEFYKRFGFEASIPPVKAGMALRINRAQIDLYPEITETEA